jgi:CDGSH-type Zn-finger protein/truncated hemoglobin YjbI
VDGLASALRRATDLEQAAALGALFAAASLKADVDEGGLTEEQAALVRGWKRDLLACGDRHFGRVADLADVLGAVNGEMRLERLPVGQLRASGSFSAASLVRLAGALDELPAVYADLRRRVEDAPADAVVMEPYPSGADRRRAEGGPPPVVDQASVLAVIDAIAPRPGVDAVRLRDIVQELAAQSGADTAPFERARATGPVPPPGAIPGDAVPPAGGLAGLLTGSYDALLTALDGGGGGVADRVSTRRQRRDAAARLWGRVLRPLAEALARGAQGAPAAGHPDHEDRGGGAAQRADVADRLRRLALAASQARATVTAPPPELLEAAAGLQDLAATLVDAGTAPAVLGECARAQAGCGRAVQVSRDGPYLLTNIEHLDSWLGEPLATRPQLALCRCGQSAAKPLCDGTHAHTDITGAKGQHRVADRRDTYRGLQVTVFDNRGTCQHSGYCTDRLPTVFRADQEPFVAPGGGPLGEIIHAARECPSGALSYALDDHEQRGAVDHSHRRPAAVEVTKDGPYRITGGIPLIDEAGRAADRNEGASLEHYALCRCGHSQNKPFCSGMHWYVEFRDPVPAPDLPPTPFEAVGGLPALRRMTRRFFERHVAADELLAPLFADAPPGHPERVAEWLAEVLGGPARYSEARGGYTYLLDRHAGLQFTERHRDRWVVLLSHAARETGLAADPHVWSMLTSYIEWQSRQLLGAPAHQASPDAPQPSPRWGWGPAGPPSPVSPPVAGSDAENPTGAAPRAGEPLSFSTHIKPMFRERDRQSMSFAFDLWSCADVTQHADAILGRLRAGTMPCDGPWPPEKVELFQRWIEEGKPA